jgi:hypothetical protein
MNKLMNQNKGVKIAQGMPQFNKILRLWRLYNKFEPR